MADVTTVEFIRTVSPYHAGETAGFAPDVAQHYVVTGAAKLVHAKVPQIDPSVATAKRAEVSAAALTHADNSRKPNPSQRAS